MTNSRKGVTVVTIITSFICFVKREALLLSVLLFLPGISLAGSASVIFNEIAWMGTTVSPNKEWIELYNVTDSPISLKGWRIVATDGTPTVSLEKIVPAHGFYLLERTSDKTLPEAAADQTYSGALENSGEMLSLIDGKNNLVDSVEATDSWFAGDNSSKQTMERKDPSAPGRSRENWQSSRSPGGTPRVANSAGPLAKAAPSSATPEPLRPTSIPSPAPGPGSADASAADQGDGTKASATTSRKDDSSLSISAGLVPPGKTKEVRENKYSFVWTFGLALLVAALGGTAIFVLRIVMNRNKS